MSGLGNHGYVVRDRDRWTPGRRTGPLSPRCGKPMTRYEPAGGPPVLEDPSCGRPESHNGPCRSDMAVTRNYRADVQRQPGALQPCRCGCGEMTSWGQYKRGHNHDSAGRWAPARSEAA